MTYAQYVPIKTARQTIASLIEQVAGGKQQFVITKFGKPKALLVPVDTISVGSQSGPLPGFGAWKGNKNIKTSASWVSETRKAWLTRPLS